MIGVSVLFSFLSGIAANQLDQLLALIPERGWELISRYIVGIVGAFAPFVLLVHSIDKTATKVAALAYAVTFIVFGLAVAAARSLKDLAGDRA